MTEKSHVGMGYELCPICGKKHDETVLLDRRLRNSLEHENFTGFSVCPECKAQSAEYLALVEAAAPAYGDRLKPENALPTGNVARVRRSKVPEIFNVKLPDTLDFVYVEPGAIDKLKAMTEPEAEPA
jgi:hypothetical protein